LQVSIPANPAYTATSYSFFLSVAGATTISASPVTVAVAAAPIIPIVTSVSPSQGSTPGGLVVTINGSNFSNATGVKFGSTSGTIVSKTMTSVTVKSPPHPAGAVDITVANSFGISVTTPTDQFTYFAGIMPCQAPITEDSEISAGTFNVNCTLDVPYGVTLTIDPGAVLKFSGRGKCMDPKTSPYWWNAVCNNYGNGNGNGNMGGYANLIVEGTLHAVGTSSQPITLTSVNDNSVGAAIGSGSPATGDWSGIISSGGTIDIEHANVSYPNGAIASTTRATTLTLSSDVITNTGPTSVEGHWFESANSYMDPSGTISNSTLSGSVNLSSGTISNSTVNGSVWVGSGTISNSTVNGSVSVGSGAVSNNTVTNGIFEDTGTISNNIVTNGIHQEQGGTISNNIVTNGIYEYYTGTISNNIVTNGIYEYAGTISNNTVTGGEIWMSSPSRANVVTGNSLITTTDQGFGYMVYSSALNFSDLNTNTYSGPVGSVPMMFSGTVANSQTMPVGRYAWVVSSKLDDIPQGVLDIPQGVTLTIEPGAVLKLSGLGGGHANLTIEGTLNASGSSSNPIIFTSVNDNTVGGRTGSGSPGSGEWTGIAVTGAATFENVIFTYAAQAVHACNWNGFCGVTARNVYWGSSAGPTPSGSQPQACGAVDYSPWYVDSSLSTTASAGIFSGYLPNCDGSPTPDQVLNAQQSELQTSQSTFTLKVAGQQIDCGNGFQDVCAEIQRETTCYAAASGVAWQNVSLGGIPAQAPIEGTAWDVVGRWLGTANSFAAQTAGAIIGLGRQVFRAASLYGQLTSAYNTCVNA